MPHFMYQGGDIVSFDGSSGYSIYGPEFELENFTIPVSTVPHTYLYLNYHGR